jgi:hypothetical protein
MLEKIKSTISNPALLQGFLAAATAAVPSAAVTLRDDGALIAQGSIARSINVSVTKPTHNRLDVFAAVTGSSDDAVFDQQFLAVHSDWADEAIRHPAWAASLRRLDEAATFDDGWDGGESLRADRAALMCAKALLIDLEGAISPEMAPKVGLDSDGSPVFSWFRRDIVGTLTVFDANTFGFYIERGEEREVVEEAKLSHSLPQGLLDILRA